LYVKLISCVGLWQAILAPVALKDQVKELLCAKKYEEAVELAEGRWHNEKVPKSEEDKSEMADSVRAQAGFSLVFDLEFDRVRNIIIIIIIIMKNIHDNNYHYNYNYNYNNRPSYYRTGEWYVF
jgi:hypothetical protein